MREHGFEVTEHYKLKTAWRAVFSHGEGGRTLGVNSEMDALPGIGKHHAKCCNGSLSSFASL